MDYNVVPEFMARLRDIDAIPARALEFLILTGVRSRAARLAQWCQFDFDKRNCTVPDLNEKGRSTLGRTNRTACR